MDKLASPVVAQQDERAMFEAWFDSVPESERMRTLLAGNRMVSLAAWEARAALSAAPERQDAQGWVGAAEWLRNNYQAHENVASLCNAMTAAAPGAVGQDAQGQKDELVAYVNGDELDNMLDDRTATIQSNASGFRKTALYIRAAPSVPTGRSIDTPEFERALLNFVRALHHSKDLSEYVPGKKAFIDHIDTHVASKVQAARDEALNESVKVAFSERDEFREQAAKNNGRESDFAFGSVNSAERIIAGIRAMRSPAATDDKGDQQ